MSLKNKLTIITFLIIMFSLLTNTVSFADNAPIRIHFFSVDACISCLKAEKYIDSLLDEFSNANMDVRLISYDVTNKKDETLLVKYNNYFNIEGDKFKLIPAAFVGDKALIGYDEIEQNLKDTIMYYQKNSFKYKDIDIQDASSSIEKQLTVAGVFLAGLLDGINPCAIAMMLFFISFVCASKEGGGGNKILLLGLSFSLGTFLAYLGIGVGIFKFIYSLSGIKLAMKLFYTLLFFMGLYLSYISILDYRSIKAGKEGKIKNQLSRKTKKRIHSIIKKLNSNKKALYLTAFFTAFVISFLEFFCTGQIYLPTITYMINSNFNYVLLLVLYNVVFVIPLLLIAFLLHIGKEVIDISTVLVAKLHIIKIVGAIFFLGVAIYSLCEIVLI